MLQQSNPKNYQNFEAYQKKQEEPQPSWRSQVPQEWQQHIPDDWQQQIPPEWQDAEVQQVVVGVKPVIQMGLGGNGFSMPNPLVDALSWMKTRRFIGGLIIGFLIAFILLDRSIISLSDSSNELTAQNEQLTQQVEDLTRELESHGYTIEYQDCMTGD